SLSCGAASFFLIFFDHFHLFANACDAFTFEILEVVAEYLTLGAHELRFQCHVIMLNFEGWKLDGYQVDGRLCVVLKMVLVGQVIWILARNRRITSSTFPKTKKSSRKTLRKDPEEDNGRMLASKMETPHPVTPPRNPNIAVTHSSPEQEPRLSSRSSCLRHVHYLLRESGIKGKEAKVLKTEMKKLAKRMGSWDKDFKNEWCIQVKLEEGSCVKWKIRFEKKEKEKVE
ncbi:hypothetical protein Tco_0397550, partial [Tanacetum coccineum]